MAASKELTESQATVRRWIEDRTAEGKRFETTRYRRWNEVNKASAYTHNNTINPTVPDKDGYPVALNLSRVGEIMEQSPDWIEVTYGRVATVGISAKDPIRDRWGQIVDHETIDSDDRVVYYYYDEDGADSHGLTDLFEGEMIRDGDDIRDLPEELRSHLDFLEIEVTSNWSIGCDQTLSLMVFTSDLGNRGLSRLANDLGIGDGDGEDITVPQEDDGVERQTF